ncbi:MAG: glycosyltransferase [Nitrospirae bacterium]|nr:glycosyltransferase [Nitrospirota bacterium]
MIKVSVIIPAYNRAGFFPRLAEALLNQDHPAEIIIVDDGSTDNTSQIIKQYPFQYIYQDNSGPAKARNTGWQKACGEVICFTDSDCIPHKDWIKRLLEGFTSDDIGAVAGSYDIANPESLLSQCVHEEIRLRHSAFMNKDNIKAFGSYNVAIRRDVLERVRGFNEAYTAASGEDNDLSYRILREGLKIKFKEDALVAHHHPEVLFKYLREQYRHGLWRMKMYKDFPDMAKGDDYTLFKDAIEVPAALMGLCMTVFAWLKPGSIALILLTAFNAVLQMPAAIGLIRIKKNIKFLYLAPITFLRSYARALGAVRGIFKFWL